VLKLSVKARTKLHVRVMSATPYRDVVVKLQRLVLLAGLIALVAACAGPRLIPGHSTHADVVAVMGEPAMRAEGAGGETVLWYPRFPFGRQSYAARMTADGRLIGIENRLTDPYIAKLKVNETRKEEVLELIGPPYRTSRFERMQREVWDYPLPCLLFSCFILYAQFSPDGVLRELYQVLDPETLSRGRPSW
jgi:hypothetical protein